MKYKFLFLFISILIHISSYGFDLYGHRGARGLAPENSLPGYAKALQIGVDYIDMDVVMTKDHVLVVHHNLTLDPVITRDRSGNWIKNKNIYIKDLTLKQLQQFDIGRIKANTAYAMYFQHQIPVDHTTIPTLVDVIKFIKKQAGDNIGFQIEIKNDPLHPNATYSPQLLARALAKIIRAEGIAKRTQVQSFDWQCLYALHKLDPTIATAYLTDTFTESFLRSKNPRIAGLFTGGKLLQNYHYSIPLMIKSLGGTHWDPEDTTITRKDIETAHQLGLKVITWSSAEDSGKDIDLAQVQRVIAFGVDGVITDRPDVVKKLK